MNILVIGSGGREHALCWKLAQSPLVESLFCAPGNAGIAECAELVPIEATDVDALAVFAEQQDIDLTIVGPEKPLVEGIVDRFRADGRKIFGPTKAAAELEGSKVFAKHFMQKYGIPTAAFRTFDYNQRFDAERFINEIPAPMVLKADGLVAGKGVTVCETKDRALDVLDQMIGQKVFGDAGLKLVIEEFLVGEEVSVFALCDGKDFLTLAPAQDHKRIFDHDLGKNTGGMGAYAPAFMITPDLMKEIERAIIQPTLYGMNLEKRSYTGCLYAGLMITETGPKVIEYNCRFGDPETQVVLPLLHSDLGELFQASVNGTLAGTSATMTDSSVVCVVISSGGYPDKYETGKKIIGLDKMRAIPEVMVFHAGTRRDGEDIITAGGRVLGVTGIGPKDDFEGTINRVYRAIEQIAFDGAYYRSDIGRKGLDRLKQLQQEGER